jgi:hypothetical protein
MGADRKGTYVRTRMRMRSSYLADVQSLTHTFYTARQVTLCLEVPKPEHAPAGSLELLVDGSVSLAVASNLRVPEWAGLAAIVVRVAVPEGAVYEDSEPAASKHKVRTARDVSRVQSPTSNA